MIFTFYSYKGGVGRSMALATVSRMLAGRGLRVLCVDFDLEAPGLEHYFFEGARSDEPRRHQGLMDLIRAYREALTDETAFEKAEFMELRRYTQTARGEVGTRGGRVDLMTAGQREPAEKERDYAFEVRGFDWQDFYFNWKGDRFFDWLRRQWTGTSGYDVVLVDSRTGITEMGGVCAYQLADAVVLLCAPNYQNLRGTRAVAIDFQSDSVTALRGRRKPLQILAIPARVEQDNPRRSQFVADFSAEIGPLPAKLASAGLTYEALTLPYLREFAIAELQIDDHLDDKELLKPAYAPFARLADALTLLADPPDPLARLSEDALARLRGDDTAITITPLEANTSQSSSGYDVFLDFGTADRPIVEVLRRRCDEAGVSVFIDTATAPGEPWSERVERALDYSATLLVCFGASGSSTYRADLLKRARQLTRLRIVPLLLPGAEVSALKSFGLDEVQYIDSRSGLADTAIAEIVALLKRPSGGEGDVAAGARDPYPGARPYTEDDATFFFGREEDIAALDAALRSSRGVLLEGPAQVGKTSLVTAGLIPRLRVDSTGSKDGWPVHRIAYVDATSDDFELPDWASSQSEPSVGESPGADVLVLDGLDTASGPPAHWNLQRFNRVDHLIETARPDLRILIVWRGTLPDEIYSDVVDDLKERGFRHLFVEPLHGEAQRLAIEQPARAAGHLLENGLVERLIESAGPARSAMLQVQLALVELWKERRRGWLSNRTLDSLGHLAGVFQKHLKKVLIDTRDPDRAAARALFTALVDVNTAGDLVMRTLSLTQLNTLPAVVRSGGSMLVESLAAAGLVDLWRIHPEATPTASQSGVRVAMVRNDVTSYLEIVGESIDLSFLTWRAGLTTQLARWQATNQGTEALLTDQTLAGAEGWLTRRGDALVEEERAFIDASLSARAARRTALKVGVTHGDICEVAAPLIVGHYQSFRLTGSEAVLDAHVGGALRRSLQLGLYPTAIGTHRVFISRAADRLNPWRLPRPEAVIVAGLGREGSVDAQGLTHAIRQAVIAWAQAWRESTPSAATFDMAATLIGSGGVGIDVGQSAESLVQGVLDANAALAERKWPEVGRLTLVERYLDRATDAFRALRERALATDRLEVDDTVHTGNGGLARPLTARYRGADHDLMIAATTEVKSGLALAYTLATKRSRNDVRAAATPESVALVREMTASLEQAGGRADAMIGRTMFRLLIPSALETFFHGSSPMVLDVDAGAAAIPWEALTPDEPGHAAEPWAVRTKLVRSIRTGPFVAQLPDADPEIAALVVGEPAADLSLYPRLPGAQHEARAVVETLTEAGPSAASVTALVSGDDAHTRPDASTILTALFERSWRIVHVSGHAVLSSTDAPGGIALGAGTVLGPREIQSLRVIPEILFASVRHAAAAPSLRSVTAPGSIRFAAELAEAFIALGVRCVVVTGLGVGDEAAVRFTTTFYRELLRGRRFADATAVARAAAHETGDMTWASYQCYGDPEWLLRPELDERAPEASPVDELLRVTSAGDLVLALDTITVNAGFGRGTRDEQRSTLRQLEEHFNRQWGHRGQVAEGFGRAWVAAGDSEKAVEWFERALAANDGGASSRAAEQAASLRVRVALASVRAAAREPRSGVARPGRSRPIADRAYKTALREARRAIEQSIGELQALAKERPTLERYNLWGGAYRRLAALERLAGKQKEEVKALEGMRRQFQTAEEIARRAQDVYAHSPAMSRMEAELALNAGSAEWKGLHSSDIAHVRASLTQLVSVEPDFWSVVALTELKLFEAISERKLAQRRAAIEQEFEDVHARVSGRSLWLGVEERARMILEKYDERATPRERSATAGLLASLTSFARAGETDR